MHGRCSMNNVDSIGHAAKVWRDCPRSFKFQTIRTYDDLFNSKSKSCKNFNDTCEIFQSPFSIPKVVPPSWLYYHNMILKFFAYFQEAIPESRLETYRVHHVEIRFFMEDSTIEISEPWTFDPGFPQGRLLNRHRVPLPGSCSGEFITLEHLNVGCTVEMYGKRFFITACDPFTRNFLNRNGTPVQLNVEPPLDYATEKRKDDAISRFISKYPGIRSCRLAEKRTQFLQNNCRVLRFWGYWDDRCQYKGRLRRFALFYFLEDDTVEIVEILSPEFGDLIPTFLKRQRLLKDLKDLSHPPGWTEEGYEILNTTKASDPCGNFLEENFITDRLYMGHPKREYYKDSDLAIGATINVYGRALILTEMDGFTQTYYCDKYGIKNFTPLVLDEGQAPMSCYPLEDVPEGYEKGINYLGVEPTRPLTADIRNLFMDKDVLIFTSMFPNPLHKVNTERRFKIKYYLMDNSFIIIELQHPNSGFPAGVFLSRIRALKPESMRASPCACEHYEPEDMFVGNTLHINGFDFILMGAEECTLSFMEKHCNVFPQSNICLILKKVREACGPLQAADLLRMFSANDTEKCGIMSARDFRCLVLDISKAAFNEHEIKTIVRAYRVMHPPACVDLETLQSVVHTELKRFGFDRMLLQRIEYTCRHYDPCHHGLIGRDVLRQVLTGSKFPVRIELIDFIVTHFPSTDPGCRINYCELMKFLDWETNEVCEAKPAAIACIMRHLCPTPPPVVTCVNYRAFLDDVCPNIKCALPTVCCPCPDVEHAAQAGSFTNVEAPYGRDEVTNCDACDESQHPTGSEGGDGVHAFFENGSSI